MSKDFFLTTVAAGYGYLKTAASSLQSLFLLCIRVHWGWQFFQTGLGKLTHIEKIISFFQSLGIPLPTLNAYLSGTTECLGGLCLLFGFASRLVSLPLIFTMIVAYATAEHEALQSLFSDPDKFTSADPFLFMLTAIIVLIFGPGLISVDTLIRGAFTKKPASESLSPIRSLA
jgi:putative oxidoreductase